MTLFTWLFAFASVAYHVQLRVPVGANLQTAALAIACVLLIRPRWSTGLLVLAIVQLGATFSEFPSNNTNRLVQFFISAAVVGAWPLRPRRWDVMRSLLALDVLVLYCWAVVHKLNRAYLDPSISCAVGLAQNIPGVGALAPAPAAIVIAITLAIESAIPLLLVFRRTRLWGVRLGVAFHVVLGFAGFLSFSATMVALLSVFVAPDEFASWSRSMTTFIAQRRMAIAAAGALAFAAFVAAMLATDPSLARAATYTTGGQSVVSLLANAFAVWQVRLLFGVWCVALVAAVTLWTPALRRHANAAAADASPLDSLRSVPAPLYVLPALMAINGAAPYLGWRTETSFAMYSNLRTEAGLENHLFLPSIPLAGYQQDLVRVLASNAPAVADLARESLPVPMLELRRGVSAAAASGAAGISVVYIRDGVEHTVASAENDADLAAPLTWIERRFVRFRPIAPRRCDH